MANKNADYKTRGLPESYEEIEKPPSLFGLIQIEQQRCADITEDAIRIIQQLSYHLLGDEGKEAKEGSSKEIPPGSANQLLNDVQLQAYRLAKLRDLIAGVSEIF